MKGSSLRISKRNQLCQYALFEPLASRTERINLLIQATKARRKYLIICCTAKFKKPFALDKERNRGGGGEGERNLTYNTRQNKEDTGGPKSHRPSSFTKVKF